MQVAGNVGSNRLVLPTMLLRRLPIVFSLGFALAAVDASAVPLPRDALWLVVRACVVAQDMIGRSFPCLQVQMPREGTLGHAVLRAPGSSTHIIVTPTNQTSGIEARSLLMDGAGAYWRAAVAARHFVVEGAGGRVRESVVGLAINSVETRSQDQLHIHAECFRPDVMATLLRDLPRGSGWYAVRGSIEGERYLARPITRGELAADNLFAFVAAMPGAAADLSRSKVLLVEAGDRFVLAVTRSSRRSIESLLDGECAAALRQG